MTTRDRAIAEIIRRRHAGLDTATLLEELLQRLPRVISYDAGLVATTDPATLLYTGAAFAEQDHVTHLPEFLVNEYLDDDVMKYADLASGPRRVDWLDRSTRGRPETSSRYRDLLEPLGLGDELRVAFVAGGSCWGVACLARERGSAPFGSQDARVMTRLGPHIAEGLRSALLLAEASNQSGDAEGPGVLLIDEDLSVVASTPRAERWLAEISTEHEPRVRGLPASVVNVVTALLTADPARGDQPEPRVRVRARSGRWLVLHAAHLAADESSTTVAVVIEPAGRGDLAPLLLQAHGLTAKESEVARLVLLGYTTKDISAAMFISEHTVQDHLKSIFAKAGVGSRRELVITILGERHPELRETLPRS